MKTIASALSDRGLMREGNEDQFLIDESLGLYVVCDGMGGHAAGEVAAERAIKFATEYIECRIDRLKSVGDAPDGYFRVLKIAEEAVQTACSELYRLAKTSSDLAGMGTTMTMLIIVDSKAIMAHVGDSRLYLLRSGEIHQLSVDHTVANELVLSGRLTPQEASTSKFQHVLTRSLGSQEYVTVDTLLFDLVPDDRFLLCTDGLSNYFSDPSVVARLVGEPTMIGRPDQLIGFANRCGGADNVTAVLVMTLAESEQAPVNDTPLRLQCLRQTFLGRQLSVGRLMQLLSIGTLIHVNAGCELLAFGDRMKGLYIVLDGAFQVNDDDIIESELTAGDCFGENSLVVPAESSASLTASKQSRVLLINRTAFNKLTRRLPRLGNALLRNLARQLSQNPRPSHASKAADPGATGPMP